MRVGGFTPCEWKMKKDRDVLMPSLAGVGDLRFGSLSRCARSHKQEMLLFHRVYCIHWTMLVPLGRVAIITLSSLLRNDWADPTETYDMHD